MFDTLKKEKAFVMNVYRSASRESIQNYLYSLVYPLLYAVAEEESAGLSVRDDDKEFVAHFYKYAFVGIVLDWISHDMDANPENIVGEVSKTIKGSFRLALENCDLRSRDRK